MKYRLFTVMLLLATLVSLTGNARATAPAAAEQPALVFVTLGSSGDVARFASTGLPMYALLDGGLLAGADGDAQQSLRAAGFSIQVLDPNLRSGTYYLAATYPGRQAPDYDLFGQVLLTTTSGVLLRMDPSQADALAQAGAELRLVTLTPKPLPTEHAEGVFPEVIDPDPLIQLMMDAVTTETAYEYLQGLAGEIPVWVDGDWYTIMSRHTNSGINIQKATSYYGQHLAELGMDVEYHQWSDETNPNVIGEIPGLVNPEDIFIIGGHIDDVQFTPGGADDNASGSVAAMIAADILSQYQWGCTLRFAVWTGEEQGLLGSQAYAYRSFQQDENIVGYLNLDMIAWNTIGSSNTIYLGYGSSVPPSHDLALLFADVVDAYNIDLLPVIGTAYSGSSDHGSFLQYGYPAILGIEGDDDFNPYYHSSQDITANTDPAYFTTYVKAAVGTFAHMSNCLIASGIGYLDGHVTADGGAPIEAAKVSADDGQGHSFPTTTDASGYYTRTLMVGDYAVTATSYGYYPETVSGVEIITDTVTTRDFTMTPLPVYSISGYVKDSVTGAPLANAEVEFLDAPVDPVFTDPTGYYSISVAEGTWNLRVRADFHMPEEREVVVTGNLSEDFLLDPLPCILLVDDDNDAPDTTPFYTAALDSLGYEYNIFEASGGAGPSLEEVQGYKMVLWYSGDAYGGTAGPGAADETALAAYLDGSGKLFLDSQDYLYDFGLTTFGQSYLGIGSFSSDTGGATNKYGVAGDPIGDGLGPLPLTYPGGFSDYGDIVNAGAGASVAFRSAVAGGNNLDVDKDGGDWQTVFFGTSWVPIQNNNPANGEAVMQRVIDWFGGCVAPQAVSITPPSQQLTGDPGTQVTFEYTVTNLGPEAQDVLLSVTNNTWLTEAPASTGMLDAGSSAAINVTVTIPTDLGSMDDTFTLSAIGTVGGFGAATGTTTANVNPAVSVMAPAGGSARPLETVSYEFTVTNKGDYTDTFSLEVSGVWTATLPGGNSTGSLAAGASATVVVLVDVLEGAQGGETDMTTLTATSELDPSVLTSASVTTTAVYVSILPIMLR